VVHRLVIACVMLAGVHAHAQTPAATPATQGAASPQPEVPAAPAPQPEVPATPQLETSAPAADARRSRRDRARAEELCAARDPSCDWVATLSTLEGASVIRALAARGHVVDPRPWGKVIGRLHVYNEEVFAEGTALLKFFNHFHITTKESAISSEAVFGPGEVWDQQRIEETARRLRDPLWTSVVAIVPVQSASPGTVDALIVTRDIWSLRFNTQYTYQQGRLTNLVTSLSENNFLGHRDVLAAGLTMDQGSLAIGPLFIDKNLLGRHLDFRARVDGILARDDLTQRSAVEWEGTQSTFTLSRPLWSLATKWAAGVAFSHRFAIDRQFLGTQLRTFDHVDPMTMAVTRFEHEWEMRRWAATASATRQWGTEVKHRISFGHSVESQRPTLLTETPGDPAAKAAFIANVLPRSEVTSVPFIEYGLFTPRYRTLRNITTFDLAEDARIGPELEVTLGFGLELLGSDANFQRLGATAGWTFPWSRDGFVRVAAAFGSRLQDGELIDNTATGLVRFATPAIARTIRLLAQSTLSTRWDDRQNRFYVIGSDTGLRGYGINEFSGDRVFGMQLEARTLPYPVWVLRLGAVVFYDLGGAEDSLSRLELHQDAGIGLRMLVPQTSAQLLKFDFAIPFDGPGRGSLRFLAGFGSEF
jgi:hypothetical protein